MSPRFDRRPDKRTGSGGRGAARPGRDGGRFYGRDREGSKEGPREGPREGSRPGRDDSGGPRSRAGDTGWDRARPAAARRLAGPRSQGERSSFSRRSPDRPGTSGRSGWNREGPPRDGAAAGGSRDWSRPPARREGTSRGPARRFEAGRSGDAPRSYGGPRRPGTSERPARVVAVDADQARPLPEAERHGEDKTPDDLIWGRHPAQAALESGRPVHRIWCTPELRFSPRFLQLLREAKASGVLVEEVTWARLGQLTGGAVHQGIVLQAAAAETLDLTSLIEGCRTVGEPPLLMALDGITDPHNLGAIARSAEALGAHGMVLPQRRSAGLTGSVAKVAAGALEHLPVARVVNLNRALETLKEEGYRVVGLASEGTVSLEQADLEGPLVIVTGSESDGLAMLTRKHCDQLVSIPLRGATPSLNASVATAMLLYEVARRGWMQGLKGGQPAPRLRRPQLPVPQPLAEAQPAVLDVPPAAEQALESVASEAAAEPQEPSAALPEALSEVSSVLESEGLIQADSVEQPEFLPEPSSDTPAAPLAEAPIPEPPVQPVPELPQATPELVQADASPSSDPAFGADITL